MGWGGCLPSQGGRVGRGEHHLGHTTKAMVSPPSRPDVHSSAFEIYPLGPTAQPALSKLILLSEESIFSSLSNSSCRILFFGTHPVSGRSNKWYVFFSGPLYSRRSLSYLGLAISSPEIHQSFIQLTISPCKLVASMQDIPKDSKVNGENKSTPDESSKHLEILVHTSTPRPQRCR